VVKPFDVVSHSSFIIPSNDFTVPFNVAHIVWVFYVAALVVVISAFVMVASP
jgi:hypothetical protein